YNAIESPSPVELSEDEVFVFPASYAQQRLWFLDQLEPNSPFYNIPSAVRLKGKLDVEALERSLNEITRRHETLRTTFEAKNDGPVQMIAPARSIALPIVELSAVPEAEREARLQELANEEAQRPFNLTTGPLFRARLLRLADDDHVALLTLHHIISDGWSMGVLIREIAILYEAFSTGKACPATKGSAEGPSPLPDLSIQYADYSEWQRGWLQGEVLESQLDYWKKQLGGELPALELPADRPRPAVQASRGATLSIDLPKPLTESLKALARQEGATLFMILLATFQTLLHRYTGQEDICVGTPIANRTRGEIEGLIGLFINTLVMRTDFSGEPAFRELLRRVREVTLGAYAHQDVPFEMVVEALHPERDTSYTPLFQVMFILQNAGGKAHELPGLTLSLIEPETKTATFDLTISTAETSAGMNVAVEYNTDLFEAATIKRVLGHYQTLLESVVATPDQSIATLNLLASAERRQLLDEWNNTLKIFPQADSCIQQLFEAQVERTP
ncbi:MAG: condensation domain-containing protein, partial [Chloroflexota bacterium]